MRLGGGASLHTAQLTARSSGYSELRPGWVPIPALLLICVWRFTVSYFPLGVFMLPAQEKEKGRLFPDF